MATNNAINNIVSGGGSIKVTSYAASDTWTKDSKCMYVDLYVWNSGGGGGSGRRGVSTTSGGGGGGGGGQFLSYSASSNFFNATETVTVAAGGTGGAAQGSDTTNGVNGGPTAQSAFGNIRIQLSVGTSSFGIGGTTTTAAGGTPETTAAQAWPWTFGIQNITGGGTGFNTVGSPGITAPSSTFAFNNMFGVTGGGGGGGYDAVTPRNAGKGGDIMQIGNGSTTVYLAGGPGGTAAGTLGGSNGTPGNLTTGGRFTGGTGGGGGACNAAGNAAGAGGVGGLPGGGGGGGSGILNGTASGAGGNGGAGYVIVVEYLHA